MYNENGAAYLQTREPPLQPPAAPTGVTASAGLPEHGETEFLRMYVSWSVASETAPLLKSSTVTAEPVNFRAPVLSTTVSSYFSSANLQPVEPNTRYRVTVTNTDSEGTSERSSLVEITSPNSDGEAEKEVSKLELCEQDQGSVTLSPGLDKRTAVQTITVHGELRACSGSFGFGSGTYTESLKTTEKVGCAVLSSASLEPNTTPLALSVTWSPAEEGTSTGALAIPLTEASLVEIHGTLEGGPFATPASIVAGTISEATRGRHLRAEGQQETRHGRDERDLQHRHHGNQMTGAGLAGVLDLLAPGRPRDEPMMRTLSREAACRNRDRRVCRL